MQKVIYFLHHSLLLQKVHNVAIRGAANNLINNKFSYKDFNQEIWLFVFIIRKLSKKIIINYVTDQSCARIQVIF